MNYTLNNVSLTKPERANLGLGMLCVKKLKFTNELHTILQLIEGGFLKFQGLVPDGERAHLELQVNMKQQNSITWDVVNTACEPPMYRCFTLGFDYGAHIFTLLVHMFGGQNWALVDEFVTSCSRFFPSSETLPAHPLVRDLNAMEVDGVTELVHCKMATSAEETEELYGEVNYESQVP